MPKKSWSTSAAERALAHAAPPPDVVEGEVIEDLPARKELILRGRAALAERDYDPDEAVDAETDDELWKGIPENTRLAIEWAWGRWITWCGRRDRNHEPPTIGTVRQYIKEHWDMTRTLPDGRVVKCGRYEQPYAPDTVELAVYLMSTVLQWKGYAPPTKHPLVHRQLKAYRDKFEQAGFRPDIPDAMTPEHNMAITRCCNLGTAGGLRTATMIRMQFDSGARASEICHIQHRDVRRFDQDVTFRVDRPGREEPVEVVVPTIRYEITISRAKVGGAAGARKVGVESVPFLVDDDGVPILDSDDRPIPHPDWDVDPARLFTRLLEVQQEQGIVDGPVFRCAKNGPARKDFPTSGIVAGRFIDKETDYADYDTQFKNALRASGVDRDPTGRRVLHYSTHSMRAGHITAGIENGMPGEVIAQGTGHNVGSDSFQRYFRSGKRFGRHNTGATIRRATRRKATRR
jgi:hypothetical protein